MKSTILSLAVLLFATASMAQENKDYVTQTFRDTRVINGQSVETNPLGELKFIISHRFGELNGGGYEMFGLDNSQMRMGLDYGVSDNLTIGVGRTSFEKTFDGYFKARLLRQQETGMPITMAWQSAIALNSVRWADESRENYFTSRLFYTHQLMIARKFHDRFSAQVMPTLVHRNLVATEADENDIISIGSAYRYQISKMLSLTTEYYYNLPNQLADDRQNSLSIGIDIDTKGHVFQLHLSNSRGMTEKFFVTNTTGDWTDGTVFLGFNITRDFKVKGRKHK